MMGGAGIRVAPQADGSVVFTMVRSPEQYRAPQNSSPSGRSSRTAASRSAGEGDGAGPSGSDTFKCGVKGCKWKNAKEGFKTERSLITHVLCHHENSDAAKRWRDLGWSKVRGETRIRKKPGETRDQTRNSRSVPSTTASRSRKASNTSGRSTPRRDSREKTKNIKTKKKTAVTPPRAKTAVKPTPLSPSRLFATNPKSPSSKRMRQSSPPGSGDDSSSSSGSDKDEDDSESGEDASDETDEDDDVEDHEDVEEAATDLGAEAMDTETAWEIVGKDESDEPKVKTEPDPNEVRTTDAAKDPNAPRPKPEPAEPAEKIEVEVVETGYFEAPIKEPAKAKEFMHIKAREKAISSDVADSMESSDVEETRFAAHPPPPSPPESRHPFAKQDSDPGTFTSRVLLRTRQVLGENAQRRGANGAPSTSRIQPAKRFSNAAEYAAYNAALVLEDAASAAAESVSFRRHITTWRVSSSVTAQELQARIDAHKDADAATSVVVLKRENAGVQFAPQTDELVQLWRDGFEPNGVNDLLGVVIESSKDGGRLGVEVLSRELLSLVEQYADLTRLTVSVGYELKTSRREFDATHVAPPLLIAPLLASLLTGHPFYKQWNQCASTAVTGKGNIPGTNQLARALALNVGQTPNNYQEVSTAITRWQNAGWFNHAQALAIRRCVCPGDLEHETVRKCAGTALLHGPPGTGKTTTLVGAISAMLLCKPTPRILVCAPSNAAVDELVFRLARQRMKSLEDDGVDRGMKPGELLRVGPSDQTNAHKFALDNLVDAHVLNLTRDGSIPRKFEEHLERKRLLENARVVATTTSAAGAEYLKDYKFDVVVIDEAAQSSEAATLIPLALRASDVKRMIFAGDHRQLSAVAHACDVDMKLAYGISPFERLLLEGHPKSTLNVQHRMNSEISKFPSAYFYGGVLQDATEVADASAFDSRFDDASVVSGGFVLRLGKYTFLDWRGEESKSSKSSCINKSEAQVVAAAVRAVLRHARDGMSVAVITPYVAQKDEIRALLPDNLNARVRCSTVDGYQGQEEDVVIFSCVRTNRLGFLKDERRLNVAITRAKKSLLIVGSAELLRKENNAWSALLEDAERRGRLHKVREASAGETEGRVTFDRDFREKTINTIEKTALERQRELAAESLSMTAEGTSRDVEGKRKMENRADTSSKRTRGDDNDLNDDIIELGDEDDDDENDNDDDAPPAQPAQPRRFAPNPHQPRRQPSPTPVRQVRRVSVNRRNIPAPPRAETPDLRSLLMSGHADAPVESPRAAHAAEQLRESLRLDELQRRENALQHERIELDRAKWEFEQRVRNASGSNHCGGGGGAGRGWNQNPNNSHGQNFDRRDSRGGGDRHDPRYRDDRDRDRDMYDEPRRGEDRGGSGRYEQGRGRGGGRRHNARSGKRGGSRNNR